MKNDSPATTASTQRLANARGEQFLFGQGFGRSDARRLRFWDEREARDWLFQFAEDMATLRTIAVNTGLWGDLAGYCDDAVLDLLAGRLVGGQLSASRALPVGTRAMQPRVEAPEVEAPYLPSKPIDSWIRIDCETILEVPIGVTVADNTGSGIRVSTQLNSAA